MEGSADEVRAMLDSGAIDIGMLENRRVPPGWERAEVGQDETVLCVPRQHPYAARSSVTPQDLDDLPMVVFDASFLQRTVLDRLCKEAGVRFRLVLQSNFVALIHQAVADGMGASTMLRSIVAQDPRLVPLPFSPAEIFHFSLCWHRDRSLSKANATFVDVAAGRFRAKPQ